MAQKFWRVRVRRLTEDWVELSADNAARAEEAAAKMHGVLSVFGRSAIPADRPIDNAFVGVEDE